jgi:hypothetical protein
MVLVAQGRFAEAERAIEDAEALHASTTLAGGSEVPVVLTASLHLARGTLPAMEPLLGGVAAATGYALFRDWHALALLASGRPLDAAVDAFTAALRRSEEAGFTAFAAASAAELARALRDRGRPDDEGLAAGLAARGHLRSMAPGVREPDLG